MSYEFVCAPCHGNNAEGLGTLYPNLNHTDYIKINRNNLSCWIKKGIGPDSTNARPTRFSDQVMPPQDKLSTIELCNILNYLNARFWNMEPFTLKEIEDQWSVCQQLKVKSNN